MLPRAGFAAQAGRMADAIAHRRRALAPSKHFQSDRADCARDPCARLVYSVAPPETSITAPLM